MLRPLVRSSHLSRRALFHFTAAKLRPAASDAIPEKPKQIRRKKGEADSIQKIAALAKAKRPRVRRQPQGLPENPEDRISLPERSSWREVFSGQKNKDRISLSCPTTAAAIAEAYVPAGSKNKVIIEAFPGPGALTRALLALPKSRIRKIIVIEDQEAYLDWLRPLALVDSRVEIVARNGFAWDTYTHLEDIGVFEDIETLPWEAGPEATASCKAVMSAKALTPYDDHFHPAAKPPSNTVPDNRRIGTPFVAVHFTPLEEQVIGDLMLDKWDYCLRRLFVMKSTPLKSAISHLAPGAPSLLPKISNPEDAKPVDIKTPIRRLTVADWASIVKAFDEWPFAPEDLLLHDGFITDGRKTD
ncbi:hypothetical protein HWV62_21606 [Athelia sp. TMB]|nr:hypothetical protein HWV62_21606 [Athelia sp. TMB]